LGLVRDMMITNRFGLSVDADRAVFVITIPDVMINLLIGGAMGAALIPEFKRRDDAEKWALLRDSSLWVLIGVGLVTVGLVFGAESLVRLLLSGLPEPAIIGTVRLVQVCLWAVPLTAVSAVIRARLQAEDRFAIPSLAGFFYNLLIVGGLGLAAVQGDLRALAIAAVIGAGLSLALQLVDVWRFRSLAPARSGIDLALGGRFFGALLAGSMVLVLPVAMRGFAAAGEMGAQTTVYLASKLVELPMGTLLSVVSIAMFPAVAEALAGNDRPEAQRLAAQGIGVIMMLALPIAVGMGVFAEGFSDLLYRHGEMTDAESARVGLAAAIMMVGLIPQAVNTMLLAICHGLRDMWMPFWLSFFGLLAFLAFGFGGVNDALVLSGLSAGFHWLVMIGLLVSLARKHQIDLRGSLIGREGAVRLGISLAAWGGLMALFWGRDQGSEHVVIGLVVGVVIFVAQLAADRPTAERIRGVILRKLGRTA
jgi:murein biosynthesis integral membrane protein MurJ